MGTEEDKTNNPVLVTIFVIGGAAMLGGSAAIVGMTRTEMENQSYELSGYADLDSVKELKDAQRKLLSESKLPIDQARDQLISDINRNPRSASWATPEPTQAAMADAAPSASASASAEPASTDAPGAGGAGAAPPGETTASPAPEATAPQAPTEGSAAPAPSAPKEPAPDSAGHGAAPAPTQPPAPAPAPEGSH